MEFRGYYNLNTFVKQHGILIIMLLHYHKSIITTVSLCNLYSYMFRHFCVINREFTTSSCEVTHM
jgi:hypothetical protein